MDPRDKVDRIDPALSADRTEHTHAKQPTEPIDRIDPAEPIDRMDPLDPIDRIEPLEPMDRIEPDEPREPDERCAVPIAAFSHAGRRRLGGAGSSQGQRCLDTRHVIHAHRVGASLDQPDGLSRTR